MKKMLKDLKHPRQPIGYAEDNIIRFKPNGIIRWMLEQGGQGKKFNLNDIAMQSFSVEDRVQFWQMLGYSVSGFGDLSFVPEEEVTACDAEAAAIYEENKKVSS